MSIDYTGARVASLEELAPGKFHSPTILATLSLAELGDILPIGQPEKLGATGYSFRPATIGTQKRLGQLSSDRKIQNFPGRLNAHTLALALATLGGEDMPAKRAAAAMAVGALTVGDVLTLIFSWHLSQNPDGLALQGLGCPACGLDFSTVRVDLSGLEVHRLEPGAPSPVATVHLVDGFPFAKMGQVDRVYIRPGRWLETFGKLTLDQWANNGLCTEAILRSAIEGISVGDGERRPVRLPPGALDDLTRRDADVISEAIATIEGGPTLVVDVDCPNCATEVTAPLDWRRLGFS